MFNYESRKSLRNKLDIQMSNNKMMNEKIVGISKENVKYQEKIQELTTIQKTFDKTIEQTLLENNDLKKELKRLRTLLTKNKIEYKKEK